MAKTTKKPTKLGAFQIAMMQGDHRQAAKLLKDAAGKPGTTKVTELMTALGVTRRSLFRYVRTLENAKLIKPDLLARRNMNGPSPAAEPAA
jgi:hypothetical protein